MDDIRFRPMVAAEMLAVRQLLDRQGLPTQDLDASHAEFILALREDKIVGGVGLERFGKAALLRSIAVDGPLQRQGLGSMLVHRAREQARAAGIADLFLLTTTAELFFAKHGFARCDRQTVPQAIAACSEFRSVCPASAVCMRLDLGKGG